MLHIASPKSASISTNNLPRAMPGAVRQNQTPMPLFGIGIKANPVITHNDAKVIKLLGESTMLKTPTEKLFTADEMAAKLGISTSYVYAKLSKLQAEPAQKVGKQAFYSGNLLEQMGTRQRRRRRAAVVPVAVTGYQATTKAVTPQNNESLLTRVANLEKQLEGLKSIEATLAEIKKILGA